MEHSQPRLPSLMASWTAFAIAVFGLPACAAAQSNNFYAGKTIKVVVGLEAGGTVDTFLRGFSGFLRKHIPGNPNIIVQKMPGGGTYAALNFLAERAPADGMTIVYNPWHPLGQAYGDVGLRARYDSFTFLGGMGDTRINYVRTDAVLGGMKKPSDIMKADSLIVGANSVGITDFSGVLASLSLKVLGVKHRVIAGFRGGADIFLAMQRGEVQFHNTSIGTFRSRSGSFIKSGEGIGLSYLVPVGANGEFVRNKYITEMPAFPDLYKDVHGKLPSGPVWEAFNWFTNQTGEMTYLGIAPRNAPPAAVAALRLGFEQAANDPEFIKESVARNGIPYSYVSVDQGQSIVRALTEVSPTILTTLRDAVSAQH
jgi:putative tricarboxylic transport membrane protein